MTKGVPVLLQRNDVHPSLIVIVLLLLIFSFISTAAYGASGNRITLDADKQFAFAQHCLDSDQFLYAADEFQRFAYFFPDDPRVPEAMYNAGMAYFFKEEYAAAIRQFEKVFRKFSDREIAVDSALQISRSYRMMGNEQAAIDILRQVAAMAESRRIKNKIFSQLGWLYLETGNPAAGREAFSAISKDACPFYHVDDLLDRIENEKKIARKSPLVAGLASIIPGGGYLYTGRYHDAMFSFVLIGAFGYAAYESFDHDLYAVGGILSATELGFYSGSIYGSMNSARKYNEEKERRYVQGMKRYSEIKIRPAPAQKGLCLSFCFHF